MYFSLQKKIFYALFLLLVLMATLFFTMFLQIYGEQYEESQASEVMRSRYVLELLHDNIKLRNQLTARGGAESEQEISERKDEISREQKLNEQLKENYNLRWETFMVGGKIIGFSSLLSLLFIVVLGIFIQRWVVVPVQKLSDISRLVAAGDYSRRIAAKRRKSFDDMDILVDTFNRMLDNIDKNIAEIKNTETFLQSLLDAIPDGIRVIDRDHNIIMVNKAYIKQTGDKELDKCYRVYGCEYPCPEGTVSCPLREIKHCSARSVSMVHNLNGRPLAVNAAPLKVFKTGAAGDFYIVEIMRDLSEDVRFSHEQKIASLGFLATSVAHEMKNNLGAVRMILEGLLEKNDSNTEITPEIRKYLQMVYNQIVTSVELPESLLRLARNTGDSKEVINVNDNIEEVLSLLDYEAKHNGISVTHRDQASGAEIKGSAADFKMIILNLAQNAFKAMTAGGSFTVSVSKNKNDVIIELKDTGTGIDPEKIKHIFEPFYSDGHHSMHKGTGLGLAIVKSLLDKFRGDISVASEVGRGTSFTVKIPKVK